MHSRLFVGKVTHGRKLPVEHVFTYPTFYFCLDLDELETISVSSGLFGHNRFRPFSIYDCDYVTPDSRTIKQKVQEQLKQNGCDDKIERIELVTVPRFFGWVFNPVSFYFCYGSSGEVRYHLAEINNTYSQRHTYIFGGPAAPIKSDDNSGTSRGLARYQVTKEFFVSPFNLVEGMYDVSFSNPEARLDVRINLVAEQETVFVSRVWGDAEALTKPAMTRLLISYPLTTFLTLPRIFWQAQKLRFIRQLPMLWVPKARSAQTLELRPRNLD